MKHSKEKPKIYDRLHDLFGIEWEGGIIITWGDTYHSKNQISDDFIAHEQVHADQQRALGHEIWWETYIADKNFRLQQEIEAYRAQVKFLREHTELYSRNVRRFAFKKLAKDLSSHIYGNIIDYKNALELITK